MRILHRYLGFFLVGIMAVYALSGIVLIFRDTDWFTIEQVNEVKVPIGTNLTELGKVLDIRRLKIEKVEGDIAFFENGTYNQKTHMAKFTTRELPYLLDKMTHLHKAKSSQPLMILNVIFGLSLLFFVISAFWMYLPGTDVFKKGMLFTFGGLVLALILLFV